MCPKTPPWNRGGPPCALPTLREALPGSERGRNSSLPRRRKSILRVSPQTSLLIDLDFYMKPLPLLLVFFVYEPSFNRKTDRCHKDRTQYQHRTTS